MFVYASNSPARYIQWSGDGQMHIESGRGMVPGELVPSSTLPLKSNNTLIIPAPTLTTIHRFKKFLIASRYA
jgi:hypothetical protein